MLDAIAGAVVVTLLVEMRVALQRFGSRLDTVEKEQSRMRALHVLPPIAGLITLFIMSGCGGERPPPLDVGSGPHGAPAAAVASLGEYAVWIGGALAIAGFIGFAFSFGNAALASLGKWAVLGIEAGGIAFVLGGCALWVADNMWTLYATALCIAAVWGWYRWPSIRRWISRRASSRAQG